LPDYGKLFPMFAAIISIFVWSFVVLSCLVYFPLALLIFCLTFLFDKKRRILHIFSCFWASSYVWINPLWNLRIEGREHIEKKKAYLLVSNHQSLLDILMLYSLFRHFKWVAKEVLFKVPFFGWNMRLNNYLSIKRDNMRSQFEMMRKAISTLKEGSSVMIFPEGTRSEDGEVHEFKQGAFKMAEKAKVPVIPIAVDGTWQSMPKRGIFMKHRQLIHVKILPPVDPAGFEKTSDLSKEVYRQITSQISQWRS